MRLIQMTQSVLLSATLLLCFVIQGCSDPGDVCDICSTSAIFYGLVRTDSGQPVVGVPVEILAHVGGCATPFRGFGLLNKTESDGSFRLRAISLHSPFVTDCIQQTANPSNDPRWPQARMEHLVRVEFRGDYLRQSRDSVRLDLVVDGANAER
jgi:hypothetical protein